MSTPSWNPFQQPGGAVGPHSDTGPAIDAVEEFERVGKPWGHEQITAVLEGRYVGKVLSITAGSSLSLQHHLLKEETLAVESGQVRIELGPDPSHLRTLTLEAGQRILIRARVVHRITAVTDARIIETSTAPPGWREDIVRHRDLYGRAGTIAP